MAGFTSAAAFAISAKRRQRPTPEQQILDHRTAVHPALRCAPPRYDLAPLSLFGIMADGDQNFIFGSSRRCTGGSGKISARPPASAGRRTVSSVPCGSGFGWRQIDRVRGGDRRPAPLRMEVNREFTGAVGAARLSLVSAKIRRAKSPRRAPSDEAGAQRPLRRLASVSPVRLRPGEIQNISPRLLHLNQPPGSASALCRQRRRAEVARRTGERQ